MDAAELTAMRWRWAHMQNMAILVGITVCTVAVAYFARSSGGLWSMLMLLCWLSPSREECECEDEEEPEGDDERPLQAQAPA